MFSQIFNMLSSENILAIERDPGARLKSKLEEAGGKIKHRNFSKR